MADKKTPQKQGENRGRKGPPKHTQFKPGQSGNPKGRPPIPKDQKDLEKRLVELLARTVELTVGIDEKGKPVKRKAMLIDHVLLSLALNKSAAGPIHILERLYGKIAQPITGDVNVRHYQVTLEDDGNDTDSSEDQ